jgi:ribosomal protein L11 methyltransferase
VACTHRRRRRLADLRDLTGRHTLAPFHHPQGCDVLLANIISGVLCELQPSFKPLLAPGGWLVLAGLLDEQVDAVVAAYAPWITLRPCGGRDGWTALAGQRVASG